MLREEYNTTESIGDSSSAMSLHISDADQCLSNLLRISSYIVSNICEKQFMEDSASIAVSNNQFHILKILSNESPINLSKLAKILLISNAAVGKMIEKLVCNRLVKRRFSKKDRRSAKISITPKGIEIVKKYNNLIIEKQIENFNQFSKNDKEKFKDYLKLFIRHCLTEKMDTNMLCYQCNGLYGEDCVVEEKMGFCPRK